MSVSMEITRRYSNPRLVHAFLLETALADVTVTIVRLGLALQYGGRLVQQIVLSKCGTVIQIHKVGDVEVRKKGTLSVHLTVIHKSTERLLYFSFLEVLLHLSTHPIDPSGPVVDPLLGSCPRALFSPVVLSIFLRLSLIFLIDVEIKI